jgi:fatty acid desaturase
MHLEATQPISATDPTGVGRDDAAGERRLELPTLAVALAVHGGFLLLTGFFRDLPLLVAAPLGSLLLAWYGSLQHETIHGHPTSSRRFNAMLGALPLSLWIPYAVYRETHLRHHRHNGRYLTKAGRDPESFYLPADEWVRTGTVLRWLYAANCTLAGRLILGPAIALTTFWVGELRKVRNGDRWRLRVWLWHLVGVVAVLAWIVGVCHVNPVIYFALVVYPSVALGQLRSFVEHHADADSRRRTRVVESRSIWALIFLNNNLHIAHHAQPKVPWYELPRVWRQMRLSAQTQGLVFDGGYWEVTQKYFFRPYIDLHRDGS